MIYNVKRKNGGRVWRLAVHAVFMHMGIQRKNVRKADRCPTCEYGKRRKWKVWQNEEKTVTDVC